MTRTVSRPAAGLFALAVALLIGFGTSSRVAAQKVEKAERADTDRAKAILKDRAVTLRGIAERTAGLAGLNPPAAGPQDVFQAKVAALYAEADAADADPARLMILNQLLAETTAYEKLVADSIRTNPAVATDARGKVDRENAMAQLKLGRLDVELAIERLK